MDAVPAPAANAPASSLPDAAPVLEARDVSLSYGGGSVRAVDGVSLLLFAGEIHALVGENGAGKSSLIRLLTAGATPDSGEIWLAGERLRARTVADAEAAGISVLHQETTVFPDLSVMDNVFVGREPRRAGGLLLDRERMRRETVALLERLGLSHVRPEMPVRDLPTAGRQMVALARALSQKSRVLILDEPTASLSAREADALFAVLRTLRAEGVALLYVSHRLDEIFALADRVTILRDGKWVESGPMADYDRAKLIARMVGRDLSAEMADEARRTPSAAGAPSEPVLIVRELGREGAFEGVSFTVHAGEVVGMGGLVGAGRSEVARVIFGADDPTSGDVIVGGERLKPGTIAGAMAAGIALVPEERKDEGLVLPMSVRDNLDLAVLRDLSSVSGTIRSGRRERETAEGLIADLRIKTASPDLPVGALSGGNQQKVALGKWLARKPRILLLDEPTRGVDVGAKAEIYRLIRRLAEGGAAVLVISSDLPELLTLSDRILVMRAGRIAGELSRADATEERVLALAFGSESATAAVSGHPSPVAGEGQGVGA